MGNSTLFTMLKGLRDRYHPFYHLRKIPMLRAVTTYLDVPVWASLRHINWRVRLRLFRNAGYLFNPLSPEPELGALVLAINDVFAPSMFWDVGAHIGYYGLLLKSVNNALEGLLFEPDPINVDLIQQTIARAAIEGLTIVPCAMSEKDGVASFALDTIGGGTGTLERPNESFNVRHYHTPPEVVEVKTVSGNSVREHSKPVSLIKVDVEGHEEQVFRGADRVLELDQPILIFECFDHHKTLLPWLQERGYFLMNAETVSENLYAATNFVALPKRYVHLKQVLADAWQQEYATWTGKSGELGR